jgi:thioredoxin-related protein
MKNLVLATVLLFGSIAAFSQTQAKAKTGVPPLELTQTDNSLLTVAKLKKNTPYMIIYFSPSCDHCIHQMDDMMKRKKELEKFQVVMATYQPLPELKDFEAKYKFSQLKNYKAGRDARFLLPPFYQIQNFPYFAFYDKAGKLLGTHEGNLTVDQILQKYK